MALTNIVKTLVLDVYDHDQTQATIKAIALDSKTRFVKATLTYEGADYPVSETATVTLTVLRPDKVGAQVVGSVVDVDNADRTGTIKGVYAELTQTALAVKGKCLCQFRITDGEQILRTEIFGINNGQALDADIEEWAGDLDGHNLDEMAESIETLESAVGTLQTDVATVKEGLLSLEQEGYPMASIQEAVDAWADENEAEIVNAYVTPEMFGAVGDGVADDTNAVTQALESGKAVYASKTYKVRNLKIDNVTLVGESQHTSLIHSTNSIILGKNINVSNLGFISDANKVLLFPGNDISIVSDGGNFLNHVIRDCKITCPTNGYNICYDLYSTFGACNVLWDNIDFHGANAVNFGVVLNQTEVRIPWMTNVNVSHCTTLDTGANSAAKMLEVKYIASGTYDRAPHLGNFNFIDNGFQVGDNFAYFAEIQYLHRGRFVNSIYDASGYTFHLLNNQNDIIIQGWGGAASPTEAIECESGVELVRNVSFADNYLGYGISSLRFPEVDANYVGRWLTQPRVDALAVSTDNGANKVTGIHVDSYKGFYTGAQYGEFQFGKDTSQRLVFRFAYSNGTWSKWMYVYNDNYVPHGTTAQRPASANTGAFYYDETLKKPLWYYASHWRDSNGNIV